MDDVLLNKAAIIERCLKRVSNTYKGREAALGTDFDQQDIIVLNLLRACEASIDAAMHLVKVNKLGIPQSGADAFELLARAEVLDMSLSASLKKMVGFRNVVTHIYQDLSLEVLKRILEYGVKDLKRWAQQLIRLADV